MTRWAAKGAEDRDLETGVVGKAVLGDSLCAKRRSVARARARVCVVSYRIPNPALDSQLTPL